MLAWQKATVRPLHDLRFLKAIALAALGLHAVVLVLNWVPLTADGAHHLATTLSTGSLFSDPQRQVALAVTHAPLHLGLTLGVFSLDGLISLYCLGLVLPAFLAQALCVGAAETCGRLVLAFVLIAMFPLSVALVPVSESWTVGSVTAALTVWLLRDASAPIWTWVCAFALSLVLPFSYLATLFTGPPLVVMAARAALRESGLRRALAVAIGLAAALATLSGLWEFAIPRDGSGSYIRHLVQSAFNLPALLLMGAVTAIVLARRGKETGTLAIVIAAILPIFVAISPSFLQPSDVWLRRTWLTIPLSLILVLVIVVIWRQIASFRRQTPHSIALVSLALLCSVIMSNIIMAFYWRSAQRDMTELLQSHSGAVAWQEMAESYPRSSGMLWNWAVPYQSLLLDHRSPQDRAMLMPPDVAVGSDRAQRLMRMTITPSRQH